MSSQQEQDLVKLAQNGNTEAISQLWDMLTPKLFGYLVNVTKDKTLAEDVLQTTWIKAIEALPKFQNRGSGLGAWLFAIARNECKQHWRKFNREIPLEENVHDVSANDDKTPNNLLVEQILSLLPPEDREILKLRYISDLPTNDIAKVLNINFVAARVRLHRAVTRARQKLIEHKLSS